MTYRLPAAILTLALALPFASFGHGVGQTLEREVGGFLIDIGYDAPEITKGQEVLFNAALLKDAGTTRWSYAPYDEVWIQIGPDGGEPMRAIIPVRTPSPVNLKYVFTDAVEHHLSVRFLGDGKTLAETSFELPVSASATTGGGQDAKGLYLMLFGVFLLVIVGVVGYRRYAELFPVRMLPKPAMKPVHEPVARSVKKTKPAVKAAPKAKKKTKAKANAKKPLPKKRP